MEPLSDSTKSPSKSGYTRTNKVPLSMKMLLGCYEAEVSTIDNTEFSEAVIVAKLKNIVLRNGKEVLTFQDGTHTADIVTFQPAGELHMNKYYKFFCVLTRVGVEYRLSCYGFSLI